MYKHVVKRMADIVLSFMGAFLLLPLFFVITVAVFVDDPGPVFFKQKRVGKNKKLFWLHVLHSISV